MWSLYPEINTELTKVEDYIKKNIVSKNKWLTGLVTGLVDAGGKRLRPVFVILSAKFGNYDSEKAVSLAGAIEILHTATLVHDDVIDQAKVRRGKRTVSDEFGSDMAVYTGDYLLTTALHMLSKGISAENLDKVALAVRTICEGEVSQYQDRFNINLSMLSYFKRISKKTAVLFGAACSLGAYIAECPDNITKVLSRFGFNYGMAFQIKDDLNDFLTNPIKSGKPVLRDLFEGTVTLPVILALQKNEKNKALVRNIFSRDNKLSNRDIDEILEMVKTSGGIQASCGILEKYISRAKEALTSLPDNYYRHILEQLASKLAEES
ncbi:MAG: polyprenyl synthetase family protein [Bacillota bacterium]|nr:polyprenyl synthetase family protein [Bacillota bacterium]